MFSSAVFRENPRHSYSPGVVIVVQKNVTFCRQPSVCTHMQCSCLAVYSLPCQNSLSLSTTLNSKLNQQVMSFSKLSDYWS